MQVVEISDEEAGQLLSFQESHFGDLKAKEILPSKLSITVSALANAVGGDIYIGIMETIVGGSKQRIWSGFADQEAANPVFQMLEQLRPIGGYYSAQFFACASLSGLILHITIHKTVNIVPASDGNVYIRRGAQNLRVADDESLHRLELDKGIATFEDETINVPIETISNSITTLEFMLEQIPTGEPETWLRSQFVIQGDKPNVAGILLFSDEPQAVLPKRSAVKIFRYKTREEGPDRETLAFDPLTIEGPIYDLVAETVQRTRSIVESIQRVGEAGLENISYPDQTLHEIITNAVLHRDYSHATDIQVRVYDDRVEVESPGKFPGHITIHNVLDEQFARNPKIVRLVNKFPNPPNKDVGEGLNTAFEAMRRIKLREPEIVERENSVVVYIRHTRLSSPAQIVMEYLDQHETITNQQGREITGIRRDVQMKDVFVMLRKSGVLEQVPGRKGRASAWRKAS